MLRKPPHRGTHPPLKILRALAAVTLLPAFLAGGIACTRGIVLASGRARGGPSDVKPLPAPPATTELRRNRIVRIALTTGSRERVVIASTGEGYRALDAATREPVWKDSWREPMTIGIRGAHPTEGRIYRVQVGSFDNKDAAEAVAARLREQLGVPVLVAWSPERKTWRIRAGEAASREEIGPIINKLRETGYPDAWIADEAIPQKEQSGLVLLDANYDTRPLEMKAIVLEPASDSAVLTVDGAGYRGSLEIRLDASGALRVINAVPVESYLRGVVPSELGPLVYPELEALKAQAVAARTYIYRNLGQFADDGYDICDSPRCQAYGGVKVEHPLSDRAVQETDGEIAMYQGIPINALYTSTCGGHTEDCSEIFPEQAAPYLMGVRCAPEERTRRERRIVLTASEGLVAAPAADAEAAALLAVHGLLPSSALTPAMLTGLVSEEEAGRWIEETGAACGFASSHRLRGTRAGRRAHGANDEAAGTGAAPKPADTHPAGGAGEADEAEGEGASAPPAGTTAAALARRIVDRLGWGSRVDLYVSREDARSWFPDDPSGLSDADAAAVAYFIDQKGWPADASGAPAPERAATRGDLVRLLAFVARSCDLFALDEGIVRGGGGGELTLTGKTGGTKAVAPDAWLFADYGSGPVPVRRMGVVPGDKIRFHLGTGDQIDQATLLPGRQGSSDDRYSSASSWEVAYTPDDLSKRLDDYLGSGRLLDIVPVRRGVSGRVTEIKIVGSNGSAVIRGFSIRTALGLKENLFTVDRQKDRSGALKRIVFNGRGWGHGVGMCQVGAYGMALRGLSYREILTHYYSGITLQRLL